MALPGNPLQVYYGGTFDPIHNGHLAIACGVRDAVQSTVRLVPAADPPHRSMPGAGAEQRLAMVELAIADQPGLVVDAIELQRAARSPSRPSYTVDTLRELRAGLGPSMPLAWVIGADSLLSLTRWHSWESLFSLAHLIVVGRPDHALPATLPPDMAQLAWNGGWCEDVGALQRHPAGVVLALRLPLRDDSSSRVRARLQAGKPVDALVSLAVADFIERHRLYRVQGD